MIVVLVEMITPSLLHSRVGTGEPFAAHWSVTVSYAFLTVIKGGGAIVITGDSKGKGKQTRRVNLKISASTYSNISAAVLSEFLDVLHATLI